MFDSQRERTWQLAAREVAGYLSLAVAGTALSIFTASVIADLGMDAAETALIMSLGAFAMAATAVMVVYFRG